MRGYDDRLIAADQGFQTSVELRSPNFMLGRIRNDERFESRMQFLAFWDFGTAYNLGRTAIGERKHTQLQSVGGGVRYRLGSYLNLRFDYGFQLGEIDGRLEEGDHGRMHLGVVASF